MGTNPHPGDDLDPSEQEEIDAFLISVLGSALSEVLHHIIGTDKQLNPATVGLRAIAIIHEMRPDILNGRSANSLAKEIQCSRAWLSKVSTHFRDTVGKFNTPAVSDRIRALQAQRTLAVHHNAYTPTSDWVRRKHMLSHNLKPLVKTER